LRGERRGGGPPRLEVGARHEADRRPPHRRFAGSPEPRPDELAGERELVEPLPPVAAHARGQHARLPSGGGDLEPGELRGDLRDAARTLEAELRVDVLPACEEAEEVRRGDGLDLAPQPLDRVPVDTREEAPVPPP